VSGRTATRNVALLVVTAAGLAGAAAGRTPSGRAAVGAAVVGLALGAAVLAAEGLAGAGARRRRAVEDEARFATVERAVAPRFEAGTLAGGRTSLDDLLAPGLPLLLVTLSPGCGPCKRLRPDVAAWAQIFADQLTVAVLATGTPEANAASYADTPHLTVVIDDGDVRARLGTTGTPSAVVVGPDGRLASGVAGGEALVRRLLVTTVTGVEPDLAESPHTDAADAEMTVDELDLESAVGPRPGITQHALGESAVLMDPSTGATVVVDATGALVWSVLDGTSRLAEIVADLADVYGVPAEVVGPDVLALVRSLGRAGLLAGVRPGPAPAADQQPVGAR
jgi:thiol-disulfide isomerase/thioredoxin